jgi:hypothetical protein
MCKKNENFVVFTIVNVIHKWIDTCDIVFNLTYDI